MTKARKLNREGVIFYDTAVLGRPTVWLQTKTEALR